MISSEDDVDSDGDFVMEKGSDDADYEPNEPSSSKRKVKTIQFTLVTDEEEEKPKPVLRLGYKGFSIYGQCLCIVVEPWPPIRAPSRAPSVLRATPALARSSSIAPPEFVSAVEARARSKTPLFLPDIDEYDGGTTPYTFSRQSLPPGNASLGENEEEDDDDDDNGGMMQFSQVLNNTGEYRAGAIDEDEDMEGAVLFGDADEYKEL